MSMKYPSILCKSNRMKQEGMTFDHDFCYFILLFSSLLKKEGREKEKKVAKLVIKSHSFLFHRQIVIPFLNSIISANHEKEMKWSNKNMIPAYNVTRIGVQSLSLLKSNKISESNSCQGYVAVVETIKIAPTLLK